MRANALCFSIKHKLPPNFLSKYNNRDKDLNFPKIDYHLSPGYPVNVIMCCLLSKTSERKKRKKYWKQLESFILDWIQWIQKHLGLTWQCENHRKYLQCVIYKKEQDTWNLLSPQTGRNRETEVAWVSERAANLHWAVWALNTVHHFITPDGSPIQLLQPPQSHDHSGQVPVAFFTLFFQQLKKPLRRSLAPSSTWCGPCRRSCTPPLKERQSDLVRTPHLLSARSQSKSKSACPPHPGGCQQTCWGWRSWTEAWPWWRSSGSWGRRSTGRARSSQWWPTRVIKRVRGHKIHCWICRLFYGQSIHQIRDKHGPGHRRD